MSSNMGSATWSKKYVCQIQRKV